MSARAADDWTNYLQPRNPVMQLMAGESVGPIPAMPICQDVPPLPFHYQRIVEKWAQRADDSGGGVDVTWEEYVKVRVEVYQEIFENFSPAPSWWSSPVQPTRPGMAGSRVERRGSQWVHITAGGREIPMGDPTALTNEEILAGTSKVQRTWDSTLGFKSFAEQGDWESAANRVAQFKAGERFSFSHEDADPDGMLAAARYQIESAGESGRFILSCGTPILPGTPADHVKYFCDLPGLI